MIGEEFLIEQLQKISNTLTSAVSKSLEKILLVKIVKETRISYLDITRATIANNVTKRPDTPTIEITSPWDADSYLTQLTCMFDAGFKTNGILEIRIDGVIKLESKAAGTFTDVSSLPLPVTENGILIQQKRKIEIFAWNDGTQGKLTVTTHFEKVK